MQALLQNAAMAVADFIMAVIPRPVPAPEALRDCRIISHRGEFDNNAVMENTLEAFHIARHHNVWGIECDIRWTADLVPVICHDSDGGRVFGEPVVIADVTFSELRKRLPLIPSLKELAAEFGGTTHLMLEIKDVPDSQPEQQGTLLAEALAGLQPGTDYHFLALDPDLFEQATFVPAQHCLPVAETNVGRLSAAALDRKLGGITGHFLLLGESIKQKHQVAGQHVGTGFVASRNCLFRELNRGIRWIFSNDAVRIQKIRDHYLAIAEGSVL